MFRYLLFCVPCWFRGDTAPSNSYLTKPISPHRPRYWQDSLRNVSSTKNKRKRKVKKKPFNIGINQRGSQTKSYQYFYDRGGPTQADINCIEGFPEVISKVHVLLMSDIPPNDGYNGKPQLQDKLEDCHYYNIASIDLPKVYFTGGLSRCDVSSEDSVTPDDDTVPTRVEVYEIKDHKDETLFHDDACVQSAGISVTNLIFSFTQSNIVYSWIQS